MGYHNRIEWRDSASFITTRSRNSELWFVQNRILEEVILGYYAKYLARYEGKSYALSIEGNHIQHLMHFPEGNRGHFMRDFNSSVAKAVARHTAEYPGGRFWGRRYSGEEVPEAADIEERFFYTVLQPVQDGLVSRIAEYPGYNCFEAAILGITKEFKVVRWKEYHDKKRWNSDIDIDEFTDTVVLKYERIPGYEHMQQAEYAAMMRAKLAEREAKIVQARRAEGKGFAGLAALKRIKRGAIPRHTKTSSIFSHRPRVLCVCPRRKADHLERYFSVREAFKIASKRYRAGESDVQFPPGTYKPYRWSGRWEAKRVA